ncbi:MAG: COX15/CtaA family protein [Acidimicrobiales bacterium]
MEASSPTGMSSGTAASTSARPETGDRSGSRLSRLTSRLPSISSTAYLRITQIALVTCVVNILTGAAVRLTDSGLGCADWPDCTYSSVTPPLSFHPIMEFGNRMVVVLLVIAVGAAFVTSFIRVQPRRDLMWLSGALVLGVFAEAGIGAAVVYSQLNPFVVMIHFLVGIVLVGTALALVLRAGRAGVRSTTKVSHRIRNVARAMLVLLVAVLVAGTYTTGTGPHAGAPGASRIAEPLADAARAHSSIVLLMGALTLVELWLLHKDSAPASVIKNAEILLGIMIAQGLVGYTQYFLHEPSLLVGIHVAGALSVVIAMLCFYDGLSHHPAEMSGRAPGADTVSAGAVSAGAETDGTLPTHLVDTAP